jgi:hypothetical protein
MDGRLGHARVNPIADAVDVEPMFRFIHDFLPGSAAVFCTTDGLLALITHEPCPDFVRSSTPVLPRFSVSSRVFICFASSVIQPECNGVLHSAGGPCILSSQIPHKYRRGAKDSYRASTLQQRGKINKS